MTSRVRDDVEMKQLSEKAHYTVKCRDMATQGCKNMPREHYLDLMNNPRGHSYEKLPLQTTSEYGLLARENEVTK